MLLSLFKERHLVYHWGRSNLVQILLICIKNKSAHSFWGQYFLLFRFSYKNNSKYSKINHYVQMHSPCSLLIIDSS